jgi:hypothetical protein
MKLYFPGTRRVPPETDGGPKVADVNYFPDCTSTRPAPPPAGDTHGAR